MLCTQPFIRDPSGKVFKTFNKDEFYKGIPIPCGHCLACRINRRRKWTLRLLLESMCYDPSDVRFLTLTYNDESLHVSTRYGPVLWIDDLVNYIKRLRYYVPNLRYFAGGEYGTKTGRPHYHVILFGCPSVYDSYVTGLWDGLKAYHLGFAYLGDSCTFDALQYVAGYVSKKVGYPSQRPKEFREFSIQSRKPAIGIPILESLKNHIERVTADGHSFPTSLTVNGRILPFDRTIMSALYRYFYRDMDSNEDTHLWSVFKQYFELRNVDIDALGFGKLADHLITESRQRNKQIRARHKLFNQGTLL